MLIKKQGKARKDLLPITQDSLMRIVKFSATISCHKIMQAIERDGVSQAQQNQKY